MKKYQRRALMKLSDKELGEIGNKATKVIQEFGDDIRHARPFIDLAVAAVECQIMIRLMEVEDEVIGNTKG